MLLAPLMSTSFTYLCCFGAATDVRYSATRFARASRGGMDSPRRKPTVSFVRRMTGKGR